MALVIIFETDNPSVQASVTAALKSMGEWAELTAQSFVLDTRHEVRTVVESLQPILGRTDCLWVFTASSPWSGYGDPIVDDHLHGYLGPAEDYAPAV